MNIHQRNGLLIALSGSPYCDNARMVAEGYNLQSFTAFFIYLFILQLVLPNKKESHEGNIGMVGAIQKKRPQLMMSI